MKISVIIPTFNREHIVLEAIRSCQEQTSPPHEIIVVDDGSTDGTPQTLEPLDRDGAIRYIRQENQGPAAARNTGIRAAQGDWIAFLDSDDVWLPGKLETQESYLAGHPDACALFGNMQNVHEDGGVSQYVADALAPKLYRDAFRYIAFQNAVPLSTLLVRRDVLLDAGLFTTDICLAEDLELLLRIGAKHRIHYQNDIIASRRRMGDNLVNDVERVVDYSIDVLLMRIEDTQDETLRQYLQDGLAHQRVKKAKILLKQARYGEASEVLSAVRIAPLVHHGKAAGCLFRKVYAWTMKRLYGSKGMQVLFVSHSEEFTGGAQKCLLDLLERTTLPKDQLRVLLPGKGNMEELIAERGVSVSIINKRRFSQPLSERSLAIECRHVLNRMVYAIPFTLFLSRHSPRIVYCNTMSNNTQMLISRFLQRRVVLHNHGLFYAWKKKVPCINMCCKDVIVVSSDEARRLRESGLRNRISVIYNGVQTPPRETHTFSETSLTLGMISSIIPHKGVDIFCRIGRELMQRHDIMLAHLGKAFEPLSYFEDLQKEYGDIMESCRLKFFGFKPNPYPYLRGFDIFFFPSREEGFPLVVLEAMACGKPVVTFRRDGRKEQITHGRDGFLCDTEEEMRDVLQELIASKELRKRIGDEARETVAARFTLEKYARAIDREIQTILAR